MQNLPLLREKKICYEIHKQKEVKMQTCNIPLTKRSHHGQLQRENQMNVLKI